MLQRLLQERRRSKTCADSVDEQTTPAAIANQTAQQRRVTWKPVTIPQHSNMRHVSHVAFVARRECDELGEGRVVAFVAQLEQGHGNAALAGEAQLEQGHGSAAPAGEAQLEQECKPLLMRLKATKRIATAETVYPQDVGNFAYLAVLAVLGGRFPSLGAALKHNEFCEASPKLAKEIHQQLQNNKDVIQHSEELELARLAKLREAISASMGGESMQSDIVWVETIFDELMMESRTGNIIGMTEQQLLTYAWAFEKAPFDDRRYFAYHCMYAAFEQLMERTEADDQSCTAGAALLHQQFAVVFPNTVYCIKSIQNHVKNGDTEQPFLGRPTSLPRAVETVLFKFISKLRTLRYPTFKSVVIDYMKRLISGTQISLNFARVTNGKYVPCVHGGVEWDGAHQSAESPAVCNHLLLTGTHLLSSLAHRYETGQLVP